MRGIGIYIYNLSGSRKIFGTIGTIGAGGTGGTIGTSGTFGTGGTDRWGRWDRWDKIIESHCPIRPKGLNRPIYPSRLSIRYFPPFYWSFGGIKSMS